MHGTPRLCRAIPLLLPLLLVSAAAGGLRRDTFFPIPVAPGQRLAFTGPRDTLVLTGGDVALFRWDGAALWLGDGRREVRIRPLADDTTTAPPTAERLAALRRTLGDPPRVRELLGGEAAAAAADAAAWYSAYRTWAAERESLAVRVLRRFRAAAPAARPDAAEDCRRLLAASPLVEPGTVAVQAPPDPAGDGYLVTYRLRGMAVESLIDLSRPAAPSPPGKRRLDRRAALGLHHLLWRVLDTGRPYRIELGRGLTVRLQGEEGE